MRSFPLRERPRGGLTCRRAAESTGGLSAPALSFTRTPGPLLQVVGLVGGAGASTLAYLTAATAAEQSRAPVLVCDTGGPTAGLAVYAGVQSARTLADTAERVAAGEPLGGGLFAQAEGGLRVIAGDPQFTVAGEREGVRRLLHDARLVHGLTVVDGGTLARSSEQAAIALATHVAWVLPASESALQRARRVLSRLAPLGRPELIIARAEGRKAPIDALGDLADERRAPLILMPHLSALAEHRIADACCEAALTLQAIAGLLQRP
jgi:Flp pilus assembly CpaE family ATPase